MRRYLPPAAALIAAAALTVFFGTVTSWQGLIGSVLLVVLVVIAVSAVFLLISAPNLARSAAREKSLRESNPDVEIISFVLGTSGRRYLATMPRLDERNGEFIPSYLTAMVRLEGIELWAGGAEPRLVFFVPADSVRSITAGAFSDAGRQYRGFILEIAGPDGKPARFTLSPLAPNSLRRITLPELDSVKANMTRRLGLT